MRCCRKKRTNRLEPGDTGGSAQGKHTGTAPEERLSRHGELNLNKPQLREIPFQTKIFKRYSRVEKALENAILESYLQGASTRKIQDIVAHLGVEKICWQMCAVHFIRAVLRKIPKKMHKEIAQLLKESLTDPQRLQECADELDIRGFPRAADTVERFIPGLLNYRIAPQELGGRIRTTNMLERLNKELKRISRPIGAFLNDASPLRLAGTILMDINEEWITGQRYLSGLEMIMCQETRAELQQFRSTTSLVSLQERTDT